ncbi:MAG TPA: hypothetical protein VHZ96_17775 [Frankiaceae bacterium]|jgi:hypothetical protein|nr:hypothetical protein [Frankiaceae bacterium]
MLKIVAKTAVVAALATAVAAALSGCEASQVSWANHTFTLSGSCLQLQTVTLHNGKAIGANGIEVDLVKVYYGDLNHDGVQDAVVMLDCSAAPTGGNGTGSEIQVFTRDAKPIARLVQPDRYGSGNPFGTQFNFNNVGVHSDVLYTGAWGWLPGDAHCCPSAYDVYRWDWNGHGFTPVDVQTNQ